MKGHPLLLLARSLIHPGLRLRRRRGAHLTSLQKTKPPRSIENLRSLGGIPSGPAAARRVAVAVAVAVKMERKERRATSAASWCPAGDRLYCSRYLSWPRPVDFSCSPPVTCVQLQYIRACFDRSGANWLRLRPEKEILHSSNF